MNVCTLSFFVMPEDTYGVVMVRVYEVSIAASQVSNHVQ